MGRSIRLITLSTCHRHGSLLEMMKVCFNLPLVPTLFKAFLPLFFHGKLIKQLDPVDGEGEAAGE